MSDLYIGLSLLLIFAVWAFLTLKCIGLRIEKHFEGKTELDDLLFQARSQYFQSRRNLGAAIEEYQAMLKRDDVKWIKLGESND